MLPISIDCTALLRIIIWPRSKRCAKFRQQKLQVSATKRIVKGKRNHPKLRRFIKWKLLFCAAEKLQWNSEAVLQWNSLAVLQWSSADPVITGGLYWCMFLCSPGKCSPQPSDWFESVRPRHVPDPDRDEQRHLGHHDPPHPRIPILVRSRA